MVAMCAGCNVLEPWVRQSPFSFIDKIFQAAIVLGIVAGAGYTTMEHVLVTWQIDDPVGSFPVHYVGGFIGVVLTPVFANSEQPYSWVYWKGQCKLETLHHQDWMAERSKAPD